MLEWDIQISNVRVYKCLKSCWQLLTAADSSAKLHSLPPSADFDPLGRALVRPSLWFPLEQEARHLGKCPKLWKLGMPVTPVPQKVWRTWPNMSHCANEITELVIFVARQSSHWWPWVNPCGTCFHGAMELAVAMPDASKVQPLQPLGLGQALFAASSCHFMSKHWPRAKARDALLQSLQTKMQTQAQS